MCLHQYFWELTFFLYKNKDIWLGSDPDPEPGLGPLVKIPDPEKDSDPQPCSYGFTCPRNNPLATTNLQKNHIYNTVIVNILYEQYCTVSCWDTGITLYYILRLTNVFYHRSKFDYVSTVEASSLPSEQLK